MMKLSCKDLDSSSGCDFEATGESAKEVIGKMMAHVKMDHPDFMKGKSEGDVKNMMEAKVH